MTIQDLIALLSSYKIALLGYFLLLPLAAYGLGIIYKPANKLSAFDYTYSVLVYAACIPGVFASLLVFYALFYIQQNLLQVDILVYFAPIVSMTATLVLISRKTKFSRLPGFDRLSGFILLTAIVGVLVLLVHKLVLFVGFFAPIQYLALAGLVVIALIAIGWEKLQGKQSK